MSARTLLGRNEIVAPEQLTQLLRAYEARIAALESMIGQGAPIVFTIKQFCACHGISQATYFSMKLDGTGPREMMVGRRRYISAESAAAWRRRCEEAADNQKDTAAAA